MYIPVSTRFIWVCSTLANNNGNRCKYIQYQDRGVIHTDYSHQLQYVYLCMCLYKDILSALIRCFEIASR